MLLTDGAAHCSSLWMLFWLITWYDRLISLWPVVLSFEFYHLNFMVYTLCIIVSQMLFLIIIFIRVWIWIHCTITQLLQYCMQHTQATACHCHWIMVVVVVWDYLFTFPLCGGNLCSKNKKKEERETKLPPKWELWNEHGKTPHSEQTQSPCQQYQQEGPPPWQRAAPIRQSSGVKFLWRAYLITLWITGPRQGMNTGHFLAIPPRGQTHSLL